MHNRLRIVSGALAAFPIAHFAPSSSNAHAEIIYTDMPDTLVWVGSSSTIDFDRNGTLDLGWGIGILDDHKCLCEGFEVDASPLGGAQTAAANFMTTAFEPSQIIGPDEPYATFFSSLYIAWASCCGQPPSCEGGWCQAGQSHFVGVRFPVDGEPRFAWVRARRQPGLMGSVVLLDYAYESQPNTPIRAGQMCSADADLSGAVGVDDLVTVINAWGPCTDRATCAADVNGDGVVNVDDLLDVINGWGPCN